MAEDKRLDEAVFIPLAQIKPNPFQPRTTDDIEATTEIAANIYRNGLMQIPSARAVNGYYELVFGHTRKAAYELLAATGIPDLDIPADPQFETMPLYVRDLDDRQMFEMALSENLKRRDLNPIEIATAMKRYMEDFAASSVEAGQLFGLNDATVRGMVRLLRLPEAAQRMVARGEITQGVARQLVSIARIDEKAAIDAATQIARGVDPRHIFQGIFNGNKAVVIMHERWGLDEPAGGAGLWPLRNSADKFPTLDPISPKNVARLLGKPEDEIALALSGGAGADPDIQQSAEVLATPPACAACPFYLVIEKRHICGLKPCHRRKTVAWLRAEAARISKKLGIPIYDPKTDGQDWTELSRNRWEEDFEADTKLVQSKDSCLRIGHNPSATRDQVWTDHPKLRVIAIGELAAGRKKQAAHSRSDEDWEARQSVWRRQAMMREAVAKFMSEAVGPLFASAFAGLENVHIMAALLDRGRGGEKRERADELRSELAQRALSDVLYSEEADDGPVRVAKYLEKVATTWGVDLPPDFREVAAKYQPVSTETDASKKGKRAWAEDEAGGDDETD